MNSRRVAALLRELADAIEAPDETAEERPAAEPKPRVSDIDKARARQALRKVGLDV